MNHTEPKSSNLLSATLIILLVAIFIATFFPAWKSLIRAWGSSGEYSHGFLMVPVALYLAWRKKTRLASMEAHPSNWGLVLVVFSLLCYLFAHFAEILTLSSFSIVLAITGVVLFFYGFSILRELSFPVFLLLFMIPIPAQIYSSLTIPLQLMVSKASVAIAGLLGMPVYREGNVIHLPGRTFQVVQACSGLRSMISLLALSAVFGYLTLRSNFLKSILFLSGIPISMLVNIVRIVLMVLVFEYFGFGLTSETIHTVFGMFIFFLAIALIFSVKRVLSFWDVSATHE